jgi:hypothetical protein
MREEDTTMAGEKKLPPWLTPKGEKGKPAPFKPCAGCKNPAACKKAGKCLKKGK